MVRVNAVDSDYISDDLTAAREAKLINFVLPKVNIRNDIDRFIELLKQSGIVRPVKIWVMLETGLGVLYSSEILAHPWVVGLIVGPNDLSKELHIQSREALMTSLSLCVLAARAHGKICIDGVFNNFKDSLGFEAEARHGRSLGFGGKTLIHPSQIEIANKVFSPSDLEIIYARKVIESFEMYDGNVAVLDGVMIEDLHVRQAKKILKFHQMTNDYKIKEE